MWLKLKFLFWFVVESCDRNPQKGSETRVFGKYWKTWALRLMHSILFAKNSVSENI